MKTSHPFIHDSSKSLKAMSAAIDNYKEPGILNEDKSKDFDVDKVGPQHDGNKVNRNEIKLSRGKIEILFFHSIKSLRFSFLDLCI